MLSKAQHLYAECGDPFGKLEQALRFPVKQGETALRVRQHDQLDGLWASARNNFPQKPRAHHQPPKYGGGQHLADGRPAEINRMAAHQCCVVCDSN